MGETGCGKTYLVKYIVEVLFKEYSVFRQFTFHNGVEEREFIFFMADLIDEANQEIERVKQMNKKEKENQENKEKEERPKIFWVFFDEFNTSHLQAYVSEIMHDRVFSLSDDPNCILFIVKLIFRL
jgi:MoxR-like ATPase